MRYLLCLATLASLAACATNAPDDSAGARETSLSGAPLATPNTPTGAPLSAMIEGSSVTSAPLDATAAPVATAPDPNAPVTTPPPIATEAPAPPKVTRYPRTPGFGDANACALYSSADAAQEAFLNAGGPITDTLGLDPDGDGVACSAGSVLPAPTPVTPTVTPVAPAAPATDSGISAADLEAVGISTDSAAGQ